MKKTRIIVGLVLAVVLVLGISVPALAAAEFSDIDDHPYEASILNLATRGFMGGYADGTFRPDTPLQRQQYAKMAVLTLGYEVTADNVSTFPDTPAPYDPVNNPLYPGSFVAVAAANQIINGYTSGNFGFIDNVTRQQAITIAVRAAGDALAEAPAEWAGALDYSDQNHGANIKKAEYNGMLAGILDALEEGATWDLTANATRGEAAEILTQLFNKTGKILKITRGEAVVELSMAEIKAMTAVEGYGGFYRSKADTVSGPDLYKGVAIQDLLALVEGGTTVKAVATDGFESEFSADEVNGVITVFDPATHEEMTEYTGTVTMILAYEMNGAPLFTGDGALRTAFVSEAEDQVVDSKKSAKQVAELIVDAPAED